MPATRTHIPHSSSSYHTSVVITFSALISSSALAERNETRFEIFGEPFTALSILSISTGLIVRSWLVRPEDTEPAELAALSGSAAGCELFVETSAHPLEAA